MVRFVEEGEQTSQVITETGAASGSVGFTPAAGPPGSRTIIAEVLQDGLPRDSFEVATYDASAIATLTVAHAGSGAGSVTSEPAGIDCGDTCATVMTGPLDLTAAPAAGSRFLGWTGACGGTDECQLNGEAATSVTAIFERIVKPKITGLTPAKAKPGRKVTVKGIGLGYITTVRIGSTKVSGFRVVSPSILTFVVPRNAKSGKVIVTGIDGSATSPKKLVVKKGKKKRLA